MRRVGSSERGGGVWASARTWSTRPLIRGMSGVIMTTCVRRSSRRAWMRNPALRLRTCSLKPASWLEAYSNVNGPKTLGPWSGVLLAIWIAQLCCMDWRALWRAWKYPPIAMPITRMKKP